MAAAASNSSPLILEDSIAKMRTSQWSTFSIDSEPAQLWTWGYNVNGELGDGTNQYKSSPIQIPGTSWSKISCGYYHTAAIKNDGTLWVWG